MQYEYMENPEIRFKRERINQIQEWTSGGLLRLTQEMYKLFNSMFTIIFSLSLTISMFYLYSPNEYTGIIAFINSPYSAIIALAVIIFNSLVNIWCDKNQIARSADAVKSVPESNRLLNFYRGIVYNYIGGMDLRMFNKAPMILKELSRYYDNPEHLKALVRNGAFFGSIRTLLGKLTTIAIYIYIGVKAYIGAFGIGNFIMYTGAIWQFMSGVSGLCSSIMTLLNNNQYLYEVFEYVDIPTTEHKGTLMIEERVDGKDEIEFHNVSFKYPGTDTYALKNLNMKLKAGQRMAIVGMNGSGKTTMIKLLCRLYDPTEGKITLNGIDVREYERAEYMSIFSVVFQDFSLFAFSLGQNVASGIEYDRESQEMLGDGRVQ
jgi:ATP-binding cassette subfamily B protein